MAIRAANIIGAGPNGLTAAIVLARAGARVTVWERSCGVGGAASTGEVTLPGFWHDLGSSAYPMAAASPVLRSMPLGMYGLQWIEPDAPLAHPLDDGTAVVLEHALDAMPGQLGAADGAAWQRMYGPLAAAWPDLVESVLGPLLALPRHPVMMAKFGAQAMLPAATLARRRFEGERARALFAGLAAHAVLPLTDVSSAGVALVLGAAGHTTGWPVAAGGAQSLSEALAGYLRSLGGEVRLGVEVKAMSDLPPADVVLFDTGAEALLRIAGDALTGGYRRRVRRFRRGPGIFKVDWALRGPIPWRAKECARAATVHVGGTLEEIEASEAGIFRGKVAERPFVLLVQPTVCDASRAPDGQHTAWGYCHVPNGFTGDLTAVIEAQMERFAPGFGDVVLARKAWGTGALESWNPNLVGGDISGGAMTVAQLVARPTLRGWRTSDEQIYLCSASTPPGGGVHGMCGFGAAMAAIEDRE